MTIDTSPIQINLQADEPYFHPSSLGPACSTPRSARLRDRRVAMAYLKRSEPTEYARLAEEVKEVYLSYEAIDPALARAKALYYVVEHAEIILDEDAFLLGGEIPFFFNLMLPALRADHYTQIAEQSLGEEARRLRDLG